MPKRRTRPLAIGVAAVIATTAASITFASPCEADGGDETRERASKSFGEAKTAFALRNYTAAATAFEEAARLVPHPAPWLDAAEAWELAGQPARAAEDCDRVVAIAGGGAHGADATRRLDRLLPKIATLDLRGRAGLAVRVDGGEPAALPMRRRMSPGRHVLAVVDLSTGTERRVDLDLRAGSAQTIDLTNGASEAEPRASSTLVAPAKEAAPPSRHAFDASPPLASWLAFGASGAFTALTVATGIATLEAKNDFESSPTRDELDHFRRYRMITNVALGGAIVAAVTGITIWLLWPRPSSPARGDVGTFNPPMNVRF